MKCQLQCPETVVNEAELYEIVKALTIDHIYSPRSIEVPYLGCISINDRNLLESTLKELVRQDFELRGLTLHCGSGILNEETGRKSKVLSIMFSHDTFGLGMYLNVLLEEIDSDKYSWSIVDEEVEVILVLLNRYFQMRLTRKDPQGLIWFVKS